MKSRLKVRLHVLLIFGFVATLFLAKVHHHESITDNHFSENCLACSALTTFLYVQIDGTWQNATYIFNNITAPTESCFVSESERLRHARAPPLPSLAV